MALKYVQTLTLYLAGSGVTIGATSASLTSLTDIYGNVLTMTDFGSKGYITFEPDTTNEEAATFTGINANANGTYTLTGVSTMLAKSPYTETSGLVRQHSGGSKVVITDNVGFWATFTNKNNDENITGLWNFTQTPTGINPGGVPDASTTVKGIGKVSVAPVSSTSPIFVGDNDPRMTPASGTSGGILGYTGANTIASSVLLTANALVLGGGAGATPVPMASLGTTTTVLHGNASGAPTFSAVSLTADVSGILPMANGGSGSSLGVIFPQVLPVNGTVNGDSSLFSASSLITGMGTNDLYTVNSPFGGTSQAAILKHSRDATTSVYYYTGTYQSDFSSRTITALPSIVVLGSYVYVIYDPSAGGATIVARYDIGTLLNPVDMTISGTIPTFGSQGHPSFTDGTFLYISDGTTETNLKKYSISGTTLTYVSTISFTSFSKSYPAWCDGTSVYQYDGTTISKWAIAGGARTTTIKYFDSNPATTEHSISNGNGHSIVGIDGTRIMLFASDNIPNVAGGSISVLGVRTFMLPVAKP